MNSEEQSFFSIGAMVVAVAAIFVAFWALVVVKDDGGKSTTVAAAGDAPAQVSVDLTDFKITPNDIKIPPAGGTLTVHNAATTQTHNLSIPGLSLTTGDIAPGGTKTLTIPARSSQESFDMLCTLPGHAQSGMTGTLQVGVAGASGDSGASGGTDTTVAGSGSGSGANDGSQPVMDWQQMDAMMAKVAKEFPAKTAGHGGDLMEPKILADGTKEYDLTAKIVDWEISPGKTVKAWTYNGVVPAPEIRVNVGDKVKVVLKNELPESTSLHFHGIRVPNSMDGVDPYTQDPIKPGETFTYEFTTKEPEVGIYHSHHDAQIQVPNGMFGAFVVGDIPLPKDLAQYGITKVDKTVNMVLNDAGTIGLSLNGKSFPATEPYTLKVGDVMEVNYFNEGLQAHPMHLHQPYGWIIAKDGVPMLTPVPGDTILVGPGERYTVVYLAKDPGVWAWHCHILNHAEGPTGMFGMVTALIVEQ